MSKIARVIISVLWLALLASLQALWNDPINRTTLRCGILLCIAALWGVGLLLLPRRWRILGVALPLLGLATLLANGPPTDPVRLRQQYLTCLEEYLQTPYLWGGESHRAIDCSGLVEQALIDACRREGLRTGRPQLLRAALEFWWHRASADALRDEYHGMTQRVLRVPRLDQLDPSQIQPGDLMVPENGEHVMAYLGDDVWIEADPTVGKVIHLNTQGGAFWFKHPALIVRWRIL